MYWPGKSLPSICRMNVVLPTEYWPMSMTSGAACPSAVTTLGKSHHVRQVMMPPERRDHPSLSARVSALDARACIFDGRRARDVVANLAYMHRAFGFFLPDAARRDSAEHFFRSNALHCTATAPDPHSC